MPNQIFFHVGMSKTGSTFLQQRVFPLFKGVEYIPTNQFKRYPKLTQQSQVEKLLLSREFDSQMEREVKKWAIQFPDTQAILVLRSPEGWMASQYRRFTKNGYGLTFREFIDIENDKGFWRRDDLYFSKKIQILEKYFSQPPLVLLYDDLRKDAKGFIQKIANYSGASIDMEAINFEKFHQSYNEKQLKIMLKAGQRLKIQNVKPFRQSLLNTIYRYGIIYPQRYGVLYGARLVPNSWVNQAPLIPTDELQAIKDYYAEDWQKCIDYINSSTH
jgi:hypothetical protein